ncbi:hypothetical protein NUW58_g6834 [Xylaria curta]|uniref:Uncharacterized protein n=1 Tax=Xylaria curta TaxID=42375 RepID=A0ACC1NP37_9PEZI|nr:hypothetical protein NUW58_g6834 [Xylaria curta]
MAGKKGGENSKKAAGQARKADAVAAKAAAEDAKKASVEDEEWQKGAKSNAKKEAAAAKKAEQARRKAENEALLAEDEKNTPGRAAPKKTKTAPKKPSRGIGSALSQLQLDDNEKERALSGSGIDKSLDIFDVIDAAKNIKLEQHPERRFPQAFAAFRERREQEMKDEGLKLKYTQRLERIREEFKTSPENPFLQAHIRRVGGAGMPSVLTDHASIAELPTQRQGNADTLVGKMDGVLRRTSTVITSATEKDSSPGPLPVAEDRAVVEAAAGQEKKKPNKHSADYIARSFIAGGVAGCAAKTTVAPLDRVKILFQTSNPQFAKYTGSWTGLGRALSDIYSQHGIVGLFRGHSATLLKIYPYAAIKFVAYEQYRALIIGAKHQETWLRRFSAGALAGVTSVLFTYPLEVIRVRLAFETGVRSSSLADLCRKIYHEHPLPKAPPAATHSSSAVVRGVAGAATTTVQVLAPRSGIINFYRGFSTTILGMVPPPTRPRTSRRRSGRGPS